MSLPRPIEALVYAFAALGAASLVYAADAATGTEGGPQGQAPRGQPPGPPPEAIAACQGKSAGATASFTDRGGRSVTGACTQIGNVLAVAPPSGGSKPGAAPPQR